MKTKCAEHGCKNEGYARCDECQEYYCAEHLTWGMCDLCHDAALGSEPEYRPRSGMLMGVE